MSLQEPRGVGAGEDADDPKTPEGAAATGPSQLELFGGPTPAEGWDRDAVHRALDELFQVAGQYKSSQAYWELMRFVARFRFYSPFNAMLVHVQMPGATFVAPAYRWRDRYRRRIRPGARPLVILQPMGPVMFVFDVSDTEPMEGAQGLPPEVERPFEVLRGEIGDELDRTVENAKRDGVRVAEQGAGSQSAGAIHLARQPAGELRFLVGQYPRPAHVSVPVRYELLLNSRHSAEARYATLVHEIAHLYCGHLGTPDPGWWPDRRGLAKRVCEFEAESVCYLVCERLGIDNPSAQYLANYLTTGQDTPAISLHCVVKAAQLIEQMGRGHLEPRKERKP